MAVSLETRAASICCVCFCFFLPSSSFSTGSDWQPTAVCPHMKSLSCRKVNSSPNKNSDHVKKITDVDQHLIAQPPKPMCRTQTLKNWQETSNNESYACIGSTSKKQWFHWLDILNWHLFSCKLISFFAAMLFYVYFSCCTFSPACRLSYFTSSKLSKQMPSFIQPLLFPDSVTSSTNPTACFFFPPVSNFTICLPPPVNPTSRPHLWVWGFSRLTQPCRSA